MFMCDRVLSKIVSSLIDRVTVNHATCRLLDLYLGLELVELNCNLHVLDGFVNKERSALKLLDSDDDGKYCLVPCVIYEVSKLRCKNTGDPQGFKAFIRMNNIPPPQMFARYVGNRLHVMFHMGGVLIHYMQELKEFLKHSKSEYSWKFILAQLEKPSIISQLQALGIIGKLVTGPWIKLSYKNEAELSNLECCQFFQTAESTIIGWQANPRRMMTTDKDVFLQPLPLHPVIKSLRNTAFNVGLKKTLATILPSILGVIQKQLEPYLTGKLSHPTPHLLDQTTSAVPHNIWAERVVGMMCQWWKKCLMAKISFLDAKIVVKAIHTLEWLDKKDFIVQEKLVVFSRQRANQQQNVRKMNEKATDEEIEKRMRETAQVRNRNLRSKVEKTLKTEIAGGTLTIFCPAFDEVVGHQRMYWEQILQADESIVGALFDHTWYCKEKRDNQTWKARLLAVSVSGLKVSYWAEDSDEAEDAEDYDISTVNFQT